MRRPHAAALVLLPVALGACGAHPAPSSSAAVPAIHYYIDPATGDDHADGTAPGRAWRDFVPLAQRTLAAGTTVSLARGSTLNGAVEINVAGTGDAPVVVDAYGTGAAPRWTLPADDKDSCLTLHGRWGVVRAQHFTGCGWSGVMISGDDMTVTDIEADGAVSGVATDPGTRRATITRSHLHDNTKMSVATPDIADDDSGAFGVVLNGDSATVSDNTISGCRGNSPDYGVDGSGVELFQATNSTIVRNRITDCNAGLELGDPATDKTVIAYNVITTSFPDSAGIVTRGTGSSLGPVRETRVYNNTILVNSTNSKGITCDDACTGKVLTVTNNIVSAPIALDIGRAPQDHNILAGIVNNATGGAGSRILAAPWLDAEHPPPGARGAGARIGAASDVDGRAVPADRAPTIGAVQVD